MPQNQPSGRGLLPSPTAWSPDQHHAAMLADVSRHMLGRTEGRGQGFGQFARTHSGNCLKCQSSSNGLSVPFAQAEYSGLLGALQSPNWVKVCLVSAVFSSQVDYAQLDQLLVIENDAVILASTTGSLEIAASGSCGTKTY